MILTTQDFFKDHEIQKTLGLVVGNTIRARNVGRDIVAALRTLVGGEVIEYTKLMAESREQSIDRMVTNAEELGANGIVGLRFTTTAITKAASEILVYGTAVILK
jgi:uncharacterized protein YbjQ (UPF0145 family)|tara:strand:- start:174 stop:488 length:315 start_codon:yes stop_codon:yes gene_type:complete